MSRRLTKDELRRWVEWEFAREMQHFYELPDEEFGDLDDYIAQEQAAARVAARVVKAKFQLVRRKAVS